MPNTFQCLPQVYILILHSFIRHDFIIRHNDDHGQLLDLEPEQDGDEPPQRVEPVRNEQPPPQIVESHDLQGDDEPQPKDERKPKDERYEPRDAELPRDLLLDVSLQQRSQSAGNQFALPAPLSHNSRVLLPSLESLQDPSKQQFPTIQSPEPSLDSLVDLRLATN